MENSKKTTQIRQWRYFETLTDLGLGADEAKIYEHLLEHPNEKASIIGEHVGISRVLTYRALDKLIEKGIVSKIDESKKVAIFEAVHPSHLTKLLERQKQKISKAELELERDIGDMASMHNLGLGKPNVQFFEGRKAVKTITSDFPTVDTEIRQWIDAGYALERGDKEFLRYAQVRLQHKIPKRMIAPNNTTTHTYAASNPSLTEVRILDQVDSLPTSIQVYDNKVTILTLREEQDIGVIIEDAAVAQLMKIIFDQQWSQLQPDQENA